MEDPAGAEARTKAETAKRALLDTLDKTSASPLAQSSHSLGSVASEALNGERLTHVDRNGRASMVDVSQVGLRRRYRMCVLARLFLYLAFKALSILLGSSRAE